MSSETAIRARFNHLPPTVGTAWDSTCRRRGLRNSSNLVPFLACFRPFLPFETTRGMRDVDGLDLGRERVKGGDMRIMGIEVDFEGGIG